MRGDGDGVCVRRCLFGTKLASAALEEGSGSTVIAQADYNLALAAAPLGADTVLYVGTIDLYRCSVAAGCVLRDTTNAENGCLNPAGWLRRSMRWRRWAAALCGQRWRAVPVDGRGGADGRGVLGGRMRGTFTT